MKKLIQLITGKPDGDGEASRKPQAEILPFLSEKEALIVQLLLDKGGETYGLALVDASNGELKRGTVYVTLDRMEDKGLVESRKEPNAPGDGPAKRLYRVTGLGQRAFAVRDMLIVGALGEPAR